MCKKRAFGPELKKSEADNRAKFLLANSGKQSVPPGDPPVTPIAGIMWKCTWQRKWCRFKVRVRVHAYVEWFDL